MAKKDPNRRRRSITVNVTGVETHHYFVCDPAMQNPLKDDQDRIMVFKTRKRALEEAAARGRETCAVVGMGDKKWKLFQAEEKHILVED